MDIVRNKIFHENKIRFKVEILFDQPYYYSSEEIKCIVKVKYFKHIENLTDDNYNISELESKEELLEYITIQLYGFATCSNELLKSLNTTTNTSINQLFSNLINFGNKDRKNLNGINKTIFTSNPHILTSNFRLDNDQGNIGPFLYTCCLPPFIPPTYNGVYVSFNYIVLITIGINNKVNNTYSNEQNEGLKANIKLPVIQKKLSFDIKCLGPHSSSLKVQLNNFQYKNQHCFPITAINKSQIDHSIEDCMYDEKVPSLTETNITYSNFSDIFNLQLLNISGTYNNNDNSNSILQNVLNLYNKKIGHLRKILTKNESLISKLRFFEFNNNISVYNHLNNCPTSPLELLWENEITFNNYPKNTRAINNNNENLTINYKNKLVINCNIHNLYNWSEKFPITIHFDFTNSVWKTQEIHIIIKRIENIENEDINNQCESKNTIVYEYKKCTLWDLEFTHQIQPVFSNITQSINTNSVTIYYQLYIYFFIYNFEREYKKINCLDINNFQNIIKLSWKSNKLNVSPKKNRINYKLFNHYSQSSIDSLGVNQISLLLPNNHISNSKLIDF